MRCEAGQTAAGASAERRPWRKVRTAQGSVAGNARPPRGADQSHRDESALRAAAKAQAGATCTQGGVKRGNLYAQQHRIGTLRPGPASVRVGGTEPRRQRAAQTDGGHADASRDAKVHRIRPIGPLHVSSLFCFFSRPCRRRRQGRPAPSIGAAAQEEHLRPPCPPASTSTPVRPVASSVAIKRMRSVQQLIPPNEGVKLGGFRECVLRIKRAGFHASSIL